MKKIRAQTNLTENTKSTKNNPQIHKQSRQLCFTAGPPCSHMRLSRPMRHPSRAWTPPHKQTSKETPCLWASSSPTTPPQTHPNPAASPPPSQPFGLCKSGDRPVYKLSTSLGTGQHKNCQHSWGQTRIITLNSCPRPDSRGKRCDGKKKNTP